MYIPNPVCEVICEVIPAADAIEPRTPVATTHGGLCDQNHEPDEDARKSYEDVNSGCAEVHLARWPLGCRPCHVPIFSMGSNLNSSTHEGWAKLNAQTALGQTLALEIGNTIFEATNNKLDCEDEWSVILVSCGLWVQVKDKLIPSLRMGSAAVSALDQALQNDPGFRSDLAAASSKEPPVNMSGDADLAGWLMTQVSELRRAKQADVAAVGASGDSHPSELLGQRSSGTGSI